MNMYIGITEKLSLVMYGLRWTQESFFRRGDRLCDSARISSRFCRNIERFEHFALHLLLSFATLAITVHCADPPILILGFLKILYGV